MSENPLEALAERSQGIRVVVIGAGIAGLVAALECAKVGMQVRVLEASDRLGGTIRRAEVAGLWVDVGADSYPDRGKAVPALVAELGLESVPVEPGQAWISGLPGGPAPMPAETLTGIPENPWDDSVRRFIGWRGAWRAYLDRVRPPLTIGQERSLGRLVRRRLGAAVHDRMVAPLTVGGYGIAPDEVDVEAVAPGLGSALTRTGSLAAAVAVLRADAPQPAQLQTFTGGMRMLVSALEDKLTELGAEFHYGTSVREISREEQWRVECDGVDVSAVAGNGVGDVVDTRAGLAGGEADAESEASGVSEPASDCHEADIVIVATDEAEARRLLSSLGELPLPRAEPAPSPARAELPAPSPAPTPPTIEVVTLVIHAPELDAHPRHVVYPIPGSAMARSVVNATARLPWLRDQAGAGIQVLRVTFPTEALAGLSDADVQALALREAAAMLSVSFDDADLSGAHRAAFHPARPASTLGHAEEAEAVRRAVGRHPGLAVVGAWLAGSGLAQTIPDAIAHADRVRHETLWGTSADAGTGIYD